VRILYVCTANICRSASAEQLLIAAVAASPELVGIEVRSAGTQAMPGSPGCSLAPALAGHAAEHRSQALTADLVEWADLILPAARDHRPSILELVPTSRTRTFTIRQAGRIADWIVDSGMVAAGRERLAAGGEGGAWAERFAAGDPRQDVQALPEDLAGRRAWVVSEMDAARGLAGAPGVARDAAVPAEPRRRWRLARARESAWGQDAAAQGSTGAGTRVGSRVAVDPSELHPDDVPDPHYLGAGLHPLAYEQIRGSTDALVRLLRAVASVG
jgi:protein-tyrosine phosphatase